MLLINSHRWRLQEPHFEVSSLKLRSLLVFVNSKKFLKVTRVNKEENGKKTLSCWMDPFFDHKTPDF